MHGQTLSESQWLAGFALSAAFTNEVFDLSAPSGAVVHDPWLKRGASEDGFWCSPPGWSFPLGTNRVSVAYVSSSGTLSFGRRKGSPVPAALPDGSGIDFLAPLQTLLGAAPEANWDLLSAPGSLFWHDTTETGSARFTWQHVLLGRDADAPVSFQAELLSSGDFVYRYDLSTLPSGAWPPTNAPAAASAAASAAGFAVGAQQGGGGETALLAVGTQACTLSNHVCAAIWRLSGTVPAAIPLCEAVADAPRFTLRWTSLDGLDPAEDDPDGDGLSNAAEVLLHHTDPLLADTDRDGVPDGEEVAAGTDPLLRDTDGDGLVDGSDPDPLTPTSLEDLDGDGIPDAYEIWRFGSTNAVDSLAIDITANGFPLSTEIAAGMNPFTEPSPAVLPFGNLASLRLFDSFQCDFDADTNLYSANPLNQYTNILRVSVPSFETFPIYDSDGNLLTNGAWSYTWDAENRLVAAYSNATLVISNAYDHAHRRALKLTASSTHTYLYDGWNLIQEEIQDQQSTVTNHFCWGKDLSGSSQGAGGVGGLLAVSINGAWHFPFYDNNGNITAYVNESGDNVATYTYDAFGQTISPSGTMAGYFPHRFSTKYHDDETSLYYYGYRFYCPALGRWMNRDPISEKIYSQNGKFALLHPVLFVLLNGTERRLRKIYSSSV